MFDQTPRTFVGTTNFHVDGMTCRRCHDAVTRRIRQVPGVSDVRIDVATDTLMVTATTPVDRVDVAAAIEAAGCDPRP